MLKQRGAHPGRGARLALLAVLVGSRDSYSGELTAGVVGVDGGFEGESRPLRGGPGEFAATTYGWASKGLRRAAASTASRGSAYRDVVMGSNQGHRRGAIASNATARTLITACPTRPADRPEAGSIR